MIEENPNIKLIDEDNTVTISIYTYNKLLFNSLYSYLVTTDNIDMSIVENLYKEG